MISLRLHVDDGWVVSVSDAGCGCCAGGPAFIDDERYDVVDWPGSGDRYPDVAHALRTIAMALLRAADRRAGKGGE